MTRSRPARLAALSILAHRRDRLRRGHVVREPLAIRPSTCDGGSHRLTPSEAPSPSAATSTLLLKVTSEGGFINPAASLAALPIVAVYADGRILTPGPVDAIYPGPLLAPVSVRDVGPSGAAAILAAIRQVGLDHPAASGPGIPGDAGTNVFTVVVDGVTTMSRFRRRPAWPPGTGRLRRRGARRRACAARPSARSERDMGLRRRRPRPTTSRRVIGSTSPRAVRRRIRKPASRLLPGPLPRRWPNSASQPFRIAGSQDFGRASRSGTMRRPSGRSSRTRRRITAFTSGGSSFTLSVRPLLPDELGG